MSAAPFPGEHTIGTRRPEGGTFDRFRWDDAIAFPGVAQLARAVWLLRSLPFERFIPMPDAVTGPLRWGSEQYRPPFRVYSAGIAGEMIVSYIPLRWYHWDGPSVTGLTPGKRYHATYFDPSLMEPLDRDTFVADTSGTWKGPITPYLHDWGVHVTLA
jgi:hypothetical protein